MAKIRIWIILFLLTVIGSEIAQLWLWASTEPIKAVIVFHAIIIISALVMGRIVLLRAFIDRQNDDPYIVEIITGLFSMLAMTPPMLVYAITVANHDQYSFFPSSAFPLHWGIVIALMLFATGFISFVIYTLFLSLQYCIEDCKRIPDEMRALLANEPILPGRFT